VLVSSRTQESQGSQAETLEPEIIKGSDPTELPAETADTTAAKARRGPRLPGFFSKVEKTVEEPETSQEAVVQARLTRAKKTTSKAGVTPEAQEKKEPDRKPASGAATTRPQPLFKTRHLIGIGVYLIAAEFILPLETSLFRQYNLEKPLGQLPILNIPLTTSLFLNLGTLLLFLLILVRLDLLPTSLTGRKAATARGQQQRREQGEGVEKPPQPTMRQGVKGEDDDLYNAYRTNQRREKKH
jgi:hypothetical protein